MTENELSTATAIQRQIAQLETLEEALLDTRDRTICVQLARHDSVYAAYGETSNRMRQMALRFVRRLLDTKHVALARMVGEELTLSAGEYLNKDFQFMRLNLGGANYEGCNFNDVLLLSLAPGASFDSCRLERLRLSREGTKAFGSASFNACSFAGARINATLDGVEAVGCDFTGARLSGSSISGVDLTGCIFTNAQCQNVNFSGSVLAGTGWEGAILDAARLPTAYKSLVESFSIIGTPVWV